MLKLFSRTCPELPPFSALDLGRVVTFEQITDDDVVKTYFNSVTTGVDFAMPLIIDEQKYNDLYSSLLQSRCVKVTGPKGCGKTIVSMVLYGLLDHKECPCAYLTKTSFNYSLSNLEYFDRFLQRLLTEAPPDVKMKITRIQSNINKEEQFARSVQDITALRSSIRLLFY